MPPSVKEVREQERAGGVLAGMDAHPGFTQPLRAGAVRGGTEPRIELTKGARLMCVDEMAYDGVELLVSQMDSAGDAFSFAGRGRSERRGSLRGPTLVLLSKADCCQKTFRPVCLTQIVLRCPPGKGKVSFSAKIASTSSVRWAGGGSHAALRPEEQGFEVRPKGVCSNCVRSRWTRKSPTPRERSTVDAQRPTAQDHSALAASSLGPGRCLPAPGRGAPSACVRSPPTSPKYSAPSSGYGPPSA